MATTHREFLCRSLGAFGAAMLAFERFGLLNALAQSAGYRALVCIFLNGGNDSGNMIIPYDDYFTYAAARESSELAIPQSSLLRTGVVPPCRCRIRISSDLDRDCTISGARASLR